MNFKFFLVGLYKSANLVEDSNIMNDHIWRLSVHSNVLHVDEGVIVVLDYDS